MKNDKVKAIVARKRPAKVVPIKTAAPAAESLKPSTPVKQFVKGNEGKQNAASPGKGANKKVDNDNIDSLLNIAKVKKPEIETSLSLNIDTSIDFSKVPSGRLPFGDKKKKLSRNERKERVMQRRIETAQGKQEKKNPFINKQRTQSQPQPQSQQQQQPESESKSVSQPSSEVESRPEPQSKPQSTAPPSYNKAKKSEPLFRNNPEIPIIGQRFVKPINEIVFTGLSMDSIGLHSHLVKTLADLMGVTELTNVQRRAVPTALEGRDILVRSQTGSGKTLAYALPIVQQLQEIRPKISRTDGIYALIIVPTRELAIQTLEVFTKLLKPFTWLVPTYITGGEKRKSEKARLRKGVNILIGTPGRICDHLLHTESFKLDKVRNLVLDEADRLYEFGYEKDVKIIIDSLNKAPEGKNPFSKSKDDADSDKDAPEQTDEATESKLQTMLLSATLTPAVKQLAGLALKTPLFIDTSDQKNVELPKTIPVVGKDETNEMIEEAVANENIVIPEKVTQTYILVPPKLRLVTLTGLIARETTGAKKSSKILIFLATENLVDYHYDLLTETLTKKKIDSDEEDDEDDDDDGMALPSDDDLEDEDGLLDEMKLKTTKRKRTTTKLLLADVKFFK